jgi:hypothetical protein
VHLDSVLLVPNLLVKVGSHTIAVGDQTFQNGCQCEPHRKTVGIDDRVNLAGQSSVRKSRIDPKIDTSAVQSYINDSFSQEHAPISGFNIFLTDQDTLAT